MNRMLQALWLEWLTQIDVRATLRPQVHPWVSHRQHHSCQEAQAMLS
jgi:hypothetical protein